MLKFIRLVICSYSGNKKKVKSEKQPVHMSVPYLVPLCVWLEGSNNRQAVTWKIILSLSVWHWLVLWGILAPMLRIYSYSEKCEPYGHYSLGFMETWCRHETCQRKTTRVFFFPLKTMTNHAFVKKQPQRKVYFTLQNEEWWCWWWWDGKDSKQYEEECVGNVAGCCAMWVMN